MRHLNKGRSLSRTFAHRRALLENLAQELFQHKRIQTTLIKAKELRPFAEKMVTTAKKDTLANRRLILAKLTRKLVVKDLFETIAPTFVNRPGGYTRIIKLGNRAGDAAPLAIIELVGFEGMVKTVSDDTAKASTSKSKSPSKGRKVTSGDDKVKKPKAEKKVPSKVNKKEKRATASTAQKRKSTSRSGSSGS